MAKQPNSPAHLGKLELSFVFLPPNAFQGGRIRVVETCAVDSPSRGMIVHEGQTDLHERQLGALVYRAIKLVRKRRDGANTQKGET